MYAQFYFAYVNFGFSFVRNGKTETLVWEPSPGELKVTAGDQMLAALTGN